LAFSTIAQYLHFLAAIYCTRGIENAHLPKGLGAQILPTSLASR